jgi:hypothetical protein
MAAGSGNKAAYYPDIKGLMPMLQKIFAATFTDRDRGILCRA